MNKGTIIAIVVGVAILLAVVLGVQYSNKKDAKVSSATGANRVCVVKGSTYTPEDDTNPASKISANITRLTCDNFKDNVDNSKGVVMVEMYLPGCSHCRAMGPIIEEMANEVVGKYRVAKIDVEKYNEIGTEFNIESVPAFIYFKNGKEVKRLVGEQKKQALLDAFKEAESK